MKKESVPKLFWFTGQAGAGKTVLAHLMKKQLYDFYFAHGEIEKKIVIIDGDDIRELWNNTDYSIDGRMKNVDFVQKLCIFLMKNDIIPIVCMVSPFALQRRFFCEENGGVEVFVHCDEIRGREQFHVDYYELPLIDNNVSFSIDTTNKTNNQSFEELWKTILLHQ